MKVKIYVTVNLFLPIRENPRGVSEKNVLLDLRTGK